MVALCHQVGDFFLDQRIVDGQLRVEPAEAVDREALLKALDCPYIVLAGADWTNDVFTVGYAGARERAPTHAVIDKPVVYDNYFVNWNYGKGTVYLVYVRSNNSTASGVRTG